MQGQINFHMLVILKFCRGVLINHLENICRVIQETLDNFQTDPHFKIPLKGPLDLFIIIIIILWGGLEQLREWN